MTEVVKQALDAGFSHIDSAACVSLSNFAILVVGRLTVLPCLSVYANEQHVGTAIRESGLARQDVWITTKYDGGDVFEEVHTSLRKVRSLAVTTFWLILLGMFDSRSWDSSILICTSYMARGSSRTGMSKDSGMI